MARVAAYLTILVAGSVSLFFVSSSGAAFAIVGGLATGVAIPLIDLAFSNARYARLLWYVLRYQNRRIRVSISYLYRIKVDDVYLLVRGERFGNYIPAGGVYKVSPGARQVFDELGILDDDLVPKDALSRNDLRIRIPAKNLIRFLHWFESGKCRETSPWREFWEELVESGILSSTTFPWIFHDYVRRDIRKLRYSDWAQSLELFVADIFELLPTPDQQKELEALRINHPSSVTWASEEQIRRRGAQPGANQSIQIGEPAEWVL